MVYFNTGQDYLKVFVNFLHDRILNILLYLSPHQILSIPRLLIRTHYFSLRISAKIARPALPNAQLDVLQGCVQLQCCTIRRHLNDGLEVKLNRFTNIRSVRCHSRVILLLHGFYF